jgi:F-type H+-transporting ATPase subunit delta
MIGGIAGRYAVALYDLADSAGALDAVEKDLIGFARVITGSDELRRLLTSPVFSRDQQRDALDALLRKGGAHQLTRNFVGLVACNRRLFVLEDMIAVFTHLMAQRRGEITASVTSARALSDAQRSELTNALKKSLGQDVTLDLTIDERLLGGLIVQVGSRMVDASIRTKLNNLKIAMKEAG